MDSEKKQSESLQKYSRAKRYMQERIQETVSNFEYDEQSGELIFVTSEGALPVRDLSAGYQSVICRNIFSYR